MKYETSILKKMMVTVTLEEIRNQRIKEMKKNLYWSPQSQEDDVFTKQ